MSRNSRFYMGLAALFVMAAAAPAEDSAAWTEELRALRKTVEQQSKEIDALTKQVAKLTAHVEGKPAAKAEPEPAPPAPAAEFSPTAPKAEPVGPPKHVIVKGETLTSIAKQYNIGLAELQKANKDVNPSKLQIGQAIVIPSNAAPKSESSTEKKDNQ